MRLRDEIFNQNNCLSKDSKYQIYFYVLWLIIFISFYLYVYSIYKKRLNNLIDCILKKMFKIGSK